VEWEVEYTEEFEEWWDGLSEAEQETVAAYVILLEKKGPTLPFPIQQRHPRGEALAHA
jgi:hypothetical protein